MLVLAVSLVSFVAQAPLAAVLASHGREIVRPLTVWGDFDSDGLQDVLVTGTSGDRLLRNRGDGGFDDVTAFCGLDPERRSRQALWADFDGDGRVDLYLACEPAPGRLLLNERGTFRDVTASSGLEGLRAPVAAARAFDFDADGALDLELVTALGTRLFHGRGDGAFSAVSLPGAVVIPGPVPPSGVIVGAGLPGSTPSAGSASPVEKPEVDGGPPDIDGGARGGVSTAGADRIALGAGIPTISWVQKGPNGTPALGTGICVDGLFDQAGGGCIEASTTPTLGMLYPLGPDLNVDAATSNVGVGTTTPSHRLHVESTANSEAAVYGRNAAVGGPTSIGVQGVSDTVSGRGVYGWATAATGSTVGVRGLANSPTGRGVLGQNIQSSGDAYGVFGTSASTQGAAVRGDATALSGTPRGVHGSSGAPGGTGVLGEANATVGIAFGVRGKVSSSAGIGVLGEATASTGFTFGLYGSSDSPQGRAVAGYNSALAGTAEGVTGTSSSSLGIGVYGEALASSGVTYGLRGKVNSSSGLGVYSEGNARVDGTLFFQGPDAAVHQGSTPMFGQAAGWNPSIFGGPGVIIEGRSGFEGGGFYADGDTAVIWSPGDQDILRIYDEDTLSLPTPEPMFTVRGNGDLAQPVASDGLVKAAVAVVDSSGTTASVVRAFNNFPGASSASVTEISDGDYLVDFGVDISARFYQATADTSFAGGLSVKASLNGTTDIRVRIYNIGLGTSSAAPFQLLVY